MALTPAPGFTSALITTSGISIYAALVALDAAQSWPKSCRVLYTIVTGAVTLSDGKHAVSTALPTGVMLTISVGSYSDVYLDSMFVAGGGTMALYMFT